MLANGFLICLQTKCLICFISVFVICPVVKYWFHLFRCISNIVFRSSFFTFSNALSSLLCILDQSLVIRVTNGSAIYYLRDSCWKCRIPADTLSTSFRCTLVIHSLFFCRSIISFCMAATNKITDCTTPYSAILFSTRFGVSY